MIYGSETWPIKKAQEKMLKVAEMGMLRWVKNSNTKRQDTKSKTVRNIADLVEVSRKIQKRRVQWFGHAMSKPRGKKATWWSVCMWTGGKQEGGQCGDGRIVSRQF
ncbi:hypothetical protein AAG570_010648 [Ranatra chinensis]|uniref:Uncharacterized protein n=1 Tax=Ranatra chinensis TaxID=642074 RepID=A0ABD0YNN2_9HEMI